MKFVPLVIHVLIIFLLFIAAFILYSPVWVGVQAASVEYERCIVCMLGWIRVGGV